MSFHGINYRLEYSRFCFNEIPNFSLQDNCPLGLLLYSIFVFLSWNLKVELGTLGYYFASFMKAVITNDIGLDQLQQKGKK